MTKSRGINRPRGIPILDWLAANSHVEPGPLDTPCLVWDGALSSGGYGKILIGGRSQFVHRVAWTERHGQIPPEAPYVLHNCDKPPCWAADHIRLGTPAENNADMVNRQRCQSGVRQLEKTHCPKGHPYSEQNTYVDKINRRYCRTCRRAQNLLTTARRTATRAQRHATRPAPINPAE